jgi:hypothetical protein
MTQFDEELEPVRKAPSLTTINAFGFKLYGKSDYDSDTESYMTTQYFVAMFLPLFPVARYRVIEEEGSTYRFLGKGKLRPFDLGHLALFAGVVIYMIATAGLK